MSADRLRLSPGGGAPAEPFAFIEPVRGALRLAALDEQAAAIGLVPGLTLADARARTPELAAVPHDAAADSRWLDRIAARCDRFTPAVAVDPPDAVLLDITGCTHLFGGEAALIAEIEARLAPLAQHLTVAAADTPEAAVALARHGTETIEALPVAALRLDPEAETALRRAGLKTIGDLAARPTAPVTARFGEAAALALARLTGRADSRLSPRRALPRLHVERRFAEPIATVTQALTVIGELAGEAAETLRERDGGGRRFAARLYRSDGLTQDLAVETSLPTRDPALVTRLFAERIDALRDPLDPGFGYDLIRLAVPRIEPLAPAQLGLEGGAVSEEAMAALIDRLASRLGRERLRRFMARDAHLPEQAAFTLPAMTAGAPKPWAAPDPGEPPLRPLHLFDPPQRIEVVAEVPDGPPHRFRWRGRLHDVSRFEGPERIAAPWWRGRVPPTRDYYRVEDVRGRRYWLFRQGLYGEQERSPDWYMHGLFA